MTTDTQPAEVVTSERAVLGAVLNKPDVLPTLRLALTGSEFYREQHAQLFAVMCDLEDSHIAPDPQAVIAELARRGALGTDGSMGVYVSTLWRDTVTAGNVGWHVGRIHEAGRVRNVQAASQRLRQYLDEWAEHGDADALFDRAAEQSLALTLAADTVLDAPVPGVTSWRSFILGTGKPRWIVPGLIRRHDTIMVLGGSGAGKSFLSRLVATSLAAGVHPFTLKPVEPVRTLLVDLENAPDQVAEETEPLLTAVERIGDPAALEANARVWMHPEGFNLRKRPDAQLLERVIAQSEPQVVCMGSLYNAYRRGRDDWDTAAEEVQDVLKKLRSRYSLGLWLEHHMPRATGGRGHTGTPYGGTMWERWPTHGRHLYRADCAAPVYLFDRAFRDDRGERDLPLAFVRGGRLPLTAVFDKVELDAYEVRDRRPA